MKKRKRTTKKTARKSSVKPSPMMWIGPSPDAVAVARDAILAFVNAKCSDEVKAEALRSFRHVCEVTNVSVSHCTFGSA